MRVFKNTLSLFVILWLLVLRFNEVMSAYRIRNPLLRQVHNKILTDMKEQGREHPEWYAVRIGEMPEDVCDKFLQATEDEETKEFLSSCFEKTDWVFYQMSHVVMRGILGWFLTPTTVNGLLQRGSMFVFSKTFFQQLLGVESSWKGEKLLDLGAGDGKVTERMAPLFQEVYATETSTTMVWRLQEKGYKILGLDEWQDGSHKYDVISCLNLIDRCERPITLLRHIRSVVKPDGRVIVAIVLPFKPYCEFGGEDHKPFEFLHIHGETFEAQVTSFIKNVFELADFEVEHFSRLPYLCEGDLDRSFYVLDDAVFVLRPVNHDKWS